METISGPFWSQAGTLRAKVATQTAKKGVWREVQNQGPRKVHFGTSRKGVQSVHSLTIAPFSLFHPCPFWLHFGLHFGVILGAKFATMLFFGRPGDPQEPQTRSFFEGCFCVDFRVPATGLATLEGLSARGGVEAACGFWSPRGRTTGGGRRTPRDPTRLMTPYGVGGYLSLSVDTRQKRTAGEPQLVVAMLW